MKIVHVYAQACKIQQICIAFKTKQASGGNRKAFFDHL